MYEYIHANEELDSFHRTPLVKYTELNKSNTNNDNNKTTT